MGNTKVDFSVASMVSNVTLAFIAFCAGSELYIPGLGRKQLWAIMVQIFSMGFLMVVIGTPIIFAMEPLMPASLLNTGIGCRWSAAWLVAVVQWAGSVIEVLAIFHETKGKGPVTTLMIGTTMLLDMIVLVFFAIGQNVVVAACPLEGVTPSILVSMFSVLGSILLWVLFGVLLGCLLQVYMKMPALGRQLNLLKPLLILSTGWAAYFGLLKFNIVLPKQVPALGLFRVDPLLICMIAAVWQNHVSEDRDREGFREILHDLAPLVLPPFFTIAGATLDLHTILQNASAVPLLFIIRFVALALGSYFASLASKQSRVVRNHLWMTLQSQSGVTLGLVAQMQLGAVGKQPWAQGTAAIITGCVVLNQLVGPTLCRFGIRSAKESQEADDVDKVFFQVPGCDRRVEFGTTEGVRGPEAAEEAPEQGGRRSRSSRKGTVAFDPTTLGNLEKVRPRTMTALTNTHNLEETERTRTQKAMSFIVEDIDWQLSDDESEADVGVHGDEESGVMIFEA